MMVLVTGGGGGTPGGQPLSATMTGDQKNSRQNRGGHATESKKGGTN